MRDTFETSNVTMAKSMKLLKIITIIEVVIILLENIFKDSGIQSIVRIITSALTIYALYLIRAENSQFKRAFSYSLAVFIIPIIQIFLIPTLGNVNLLSLEENIFNKNIILLIGVILIIMFVLNFFKDKNIYGGIKAYNEDKGYHHLKVKSLAEKAWKLTWLMYVILLVTIALLGILVLMTMFGNEDHLFLRSNILFFLLPIIIILGISIYLFITRIKLFGLCQEIFGKTPFTAEDEHEELGDQL